MIDFLFDSVQFEPVQKFQTPDLFKSFD